MATTVPAGADELGAEQGEVPDVGTHVDEHLARAQRALQPIGHVGLPQAVEDDPRRDGRITGVDQHLGAPARGDQRGVVSEVEGSVGVALRLDGGEPGFDAVEALRQVLDAQGPARACRQSGHQGMTTHGCSSYGHRRWRVRARMRSARVS